MRNIRQLCVAFLMTMVTACGGGGTIGSSNTGGGTTTPTTTVTLALKGVAGAQAPASLTANTPIEVHATVLTNGQPAVNQLVTFTLNDTALASFSNDAGTARTNDSGVAVIRLSVGTKSGAGLVTATISENVKASVAFDSAGTVVVKPVTIKVAAQYTSVTDTKLSKTNPAELIVTLTSLDNDKNALANRLITFSAATTNFVVFANSTQTALTDANGVAVMPIKVGTASGISQVTAALDDSTKATVLIDSKGDAGNTVTELQVALELLDRDTNQVVTPATISRAKKLRAKATVTSRSGELQPGKVVKFAIDTPNLVVFGNDTASAETGSSGVDAGVAYIDLNVGTLSGTGYLTASLADNADINVKKAITSSGDGAIVDPQPVGSIVLYADKLALLTGSSDRVELTALVRDKNGILMPDVKVQFSVPEADDAVLQVQNNITGKDGLAKATLSSTTNRMNRTITVSAIAGSNNLTKDVTINVDGTDISAVLPSAVVLNSKTQLLFSLLDSRKDGIPNQPLVVTSKAGNTLSAASFNTNINTGTLAVDFTAVKSGNDEISVAWTQSGKTLTKTFPIAVSSDQYTYIDSSSNPIASDAVAEVAIEDVNSGKLDLLWKRNGSAVNASNVEFATNRGGLSTTANGAVAATQTVVTNSNGVASVFARSDFAGFATISAKSNMVVDGQATERTAVRLIEFVSNTPTKIETQAFPTQIGVGDKSTITAVVRDSRNNPVKNQVVVFSVQDSAGGVLTPVTAKTNSFGVATTVFTADLPTAGSGGANTATGLRVKATLASNNTVENQTEITVGRQTLFFRFGTGNLISEKEQSLFVKQFAIVVTDAAGNAVPGQQLNVSVYPIRYKLGYWYRSPPGGVFRNWSASVTSDLNHVSCLSEDINRNGILDPNEDRDGNKELTPGNVASVPRVVTVGNDGVALFEMTYPRDHAPWVDVEIVVRGTAAGTENVYSRMFGLSSVAYTDPAVSPPANPYGIGPVVIPSNNFGETLPYTGTGVACASRFQ